MTGRLAFPCAAAVIPGAGWGQLLCHGTCLKTVLLCWYCGSYTKYCAWITVLKLNFSNIVLGAVQLEQPLSGLPEK